MPIVATIEEIAERLGRLAPGEIAVVEGFCGSGKSSLVDRLAKQVAMSVCHLDSFAKQFGNPPQYRECLDIDALRNWLEKRNTSLPTVVEGICLRDVLEGICVAPALSIYVKRVGKSGLWHDGLDLDDYEDGTSNPQCMEEPHRSDLEYHIRMRPQERADLIFERLEQD